MAEAMKDETEQVPIRALLSKYDLRRKPAQVVRFAAQHEDKRIEKKAQEKTGQAAPKKPRGSAADAMSVDADDAVVTGAMTDEAAVTGAVLHENIVKMLMDRAVMACDVCTGTCPAKKGVDVFSECRTRVRGMIGFGKMLSSSITASGAVVCIATLPVTEVQRKYLRETYPVYYKLLEREVAAVKVIQSFIPNRGAKDISEDDVKKILGVSDDDKLKILYSAVNSALTNKMHDIIHEVSVGVVIRDMVVMGGFSPCFSIPLYFGVCSSIIESKIDCAGDDCVFPWTDLVKGRGYSERQTAIVQTRVKRSSRRYLVDVSDVGMFSQCALGLACQLLHALDTARSRCGFIHNDLHYGNVCTMSAPSAWKEQGWVFNNEFEPDKPMRIPPSLHAGIVCSVIDFGRSVVGIRPFRFDESGHNRDTGGVPISIHELMCRGTPSASAGHHADIMHDVETGIKFGEFEDLGISDNPSSPNYVIDQFNWFIGTLSLSGTNTDSDFMRLVDIAVPIRMRGAMLEEYIGRILMDGTLTKIQLYHTIVFAHKMRNVLHIGAASVINTFRRSIGSARKLRESVMLVESQPINKQLRGFDPSTFIPDVGLVDARFRSRIFIADDGKGPVHDSSAKLGNRALERYRAIAIGAFVINGEAKLIDSKLPNYESGGMEDMLMRAVNVTRTVKEGDNKTFNETTITTALTYTCVFTDRYADIVPRGRDPSTYVPVREDYQKLLRDTYRYAADLLSTKYSMPASTTTRYIVGPDKKANADVIVDILTAKEPKAIGAPSEEPAAAEHHVGAVPCAYCGNPSSSICSRCESVSYCNHYHQLIHWDTHRHVCRHQHPF